MIFRVKLASSSRKIIEDILKYLLLFQIKDANEFYGDAQMHKYIFMNQQTKQNNLSCGTIYEATW